jgi:anti-sigma factor RsiW
MPPHDRLVGTLRCAEVLARLSAFVDGELPAEEVDRIRGHLAGCDWCERFGGGFAGVLAALRRELGRPDPVPDEVAGRLAERLQSL